MNFTRPSPPLAVAWLPCRRSVEYRANLLFLRIAFGPRNIRVVEHVVMVVIALHLNWDGDRFENGFRVVMRMMFDWNVNANSETGKS